MVSFRRRRAQSILGVLYYKGIGIPSDYTQAAYWIRLAAEQGNPNAETHLASLYEFGQGVSLDYAAAYLWYARAAAAGQKSGAEQLKSLKHRLTQSNSTVSPPFSLHPALGLHRRLRCS